MASRGYTTPAAVAVRLGATFTPEQTAACDQQIEALESHLDHTIRRRWLLPDPTTVTHSAPLYGPTLQLPVAPLGAVTSVTVTQPWVGATPTVLDEGLGYAVVDAPTAVLTIAGYGGCSYPYPARVVVVYTQPVGDPVPADVAEACTRTVAVWLAPTLPSGAMSDAGGAIAAAAAGVKSYQVGQELRVEYADRASASGGGSSGGASAGAVPSPLPADAAALLAPYGYPPTWSGTFA